MLQSVLLMQSSLADGHAGFLASIPLMTIKKLIATPCSSWPPEYSRRVRISRYPEWPFLDPWLICLSSVLLRFLRTTENIEKETATQNVFRNFLESSTLPCFQEPQIWFFIQRLFTNYSI